MAKDIRIQYIDRKGEKGSMQLPVKDTPVEAEIKAFTALSMIGWEEYTETTTTTISSAQALDSTDVVNNDKDFKCNLSFKGASGYVRISLPCPKINIEAGIVIRYGSERAFVPASKITGEVGNDGGEIATLLNTMTGETYTFSSGRLKKAP